MAKKIISAWIQQEIQFDDPDEYERYVADLTTSKVKSFIENTKREGNIITITVMKQYNKNVFPFEERSKTQ